MAVVSNEKSRAEMNSPLEEATCKFEQVTPDVATAPNLFITIVVAEAAVSTGTLPTIERTPVSLAEES
jgi:hypothetical protein